MGISVALVSQIERGGISTPPATTLRRRLGGRLPAWEDIQFRTHNAIAIGRRTEA
jgi:hypothetical protein